MTTNLACAFMLLQRVADFEAETGAEVQVSLLSNGEFVLTIGSGKMPERAMTFKTATEAVEFFKGPKP